MTGIKVRILNDLPILNALFLKKYKRSATVYKFLIARDKFMPEMHLTQPQFKYSAGGPFNKNKIRVKNLRKQEIQDIFIKTN